MARDKEARIRRRRRNRRRLALGAGTGATLTYLLDPDQGRRRRALLADRARSARNDLSGTADVVVRDGRNRVRGLKAEADRLINPSPSGDAHLYHRVTEEVAAESRHPRAIGVKVVDGDVTLTGPILVDEVDRVRSAVLRIPGVTSVEDRLEVHDDPGNVPALQGEGRTSGPGPHLHRQHWAPAPRAVAGAAGGALMAYGLARRGLRGLGGIAGGGLLLARAATNLPVRKLTGVGSGADAVEVDKTIDIAAPVDEVWAAWSRFEAFPTFMSHVRSVETGDGDRSHWVVEGPLGATVEWDAEVTEEEPNRLLAWRTLPGSPIQHTGEVSFEPADGASRIHVRLAYNPAAGAAGHAVARLLGADARQQLDDDLLRMKTMLETGAQPRDAATR